MTFSTLDHLECPRCGATYDADVLQGLCPADGSPLLARYDLTASPAAPRTIAGRAPDLWRYHELLPVSGAEHVVTLGEGMTPLLALRGSAPSSACRACWSRTRGCSRPARSRHAAPRSASRGRRSSA